MTILSRARLSLLLALLLILAACSPGAAEPTTPSFSGAPTLNIAAPLPNETYQQGAPVNILLRVENAGSDVARVAVRVDDVTIGEAIQPNESGKAVFTVVNSWTADEPGTHTISAVASRSTGENGEASVTINVVADEEPTTPPTNTPQPEPTDPPADGDTASEDTAAPAGDDMQTDTESEPTTAPEPTTPPEPTEPPPPSATPTSSVPLAQITQGVNVRNGPGTNFDVIGSYAAGETPEALAINPAGTWYKIRYYNNEGWVIGSAVEVQGNAAAIPQEAGPPTPIPFTATPVPTSTPDTAVDLTITDFSDTSPFPLVCNEPSVSSVTVTNAGTQTSPATVVVLGDLFNGNIEATTTQQVPALAPQESRTYQMSITVSTNVGQTHTLRVVVDPENNVAETNENNNSAEETYSPLEQGDCP